MIKCFMSIFSKLKLKKEPKDENKEMEDDQLKPAGELKMARKVKILAEEKKTAAKAKPAARSAKKNIAGAKTKDSRLENILIRPLITEKGSMIGSLNQYVFEVAVKTNKVEIKKAVEQVYGVKPAKVNIVKMPGKSVRFGRSISHRKARKKAIVTLKPGEKIEVYAGV